MCLYRYLAMPAQVSSTGIKRALAAIDLSKVAPGYSDSGTSAFSTDHRRIGRVDWSVQVETPEAGNVGGSRCVRKCDAGQR